MLAAMPYNLSHTFQCRKDATTRTLPVRVGEASSRARFQRQGSWRAQKSDNISAELKKEVMLLVTGTERGKRATPQQQASILKAIEALEATNPTVKPVQSPFISGSWALVYQGPSSVDEGLSIDARLEGPFLARFQPLTRGMVKTGANIQVIDLAGGKVENLATFRVFNWLEGSINIKGTAKPATAPEEDVKVDVEFKEFELKLGSLSATISLSAVKPKGWVLTTYLDEDTRVGRGDKGSIFFTKRLAKADGL